MAYTASCLPRLRGSAYTKCRRHLDLEMELFAQIGGDPFGSLTFNDDSVLFHDPASKIGERGVFGWVQSMVASDPYNIPIEVSLVGVATSEMMVTSPAGTVMRRWMAICAPTAWLPGFDEERWDADGMYPQGRGVELQANLNMCGLTPV